MPASDCPRPDRATRRRKLRRRLEPWLLGLGGFTLTAAATLLLDPKHSSDRRFAGVPGHIATLAAR